MSTEVNLDWEEIDNYIKTGKSQEKSKHVKTPFSLPYFGGNSRFLKSFFGLWESDYGNQPFVFIPESVFDSVFSVITEDKQGSVYQCLVSAVKALDKNPSLAKLEI